MKLNEPCPKADGVNGGFHITITSPVNGRRICLMCAEIIEIEEEGEEEK